MSSTYGKPFDDCINCGMSTSALRCELENLKRRILDRDLTIVQLEAQMSQERPEVFPQGQVSLLRAQCEHWQDKYDRLIEAHKRVQKVNQSLEDKLLRLVDRMENEKSSLAADTANLTTALTTAAQAINRLKQENECYKNDLNLAIQLLQCNPSKYAAQKLQSLPSDVQKAARMQATRESREKSDAKVIRVPIPTFPPTAMVYSVNKYADDSSNEEDESVSAAIVAAILEERQRERAKRHCATCTCRSGSDTKAKIGNGNHKQANNYSPTDMTRGRGGKDRSIVNMGTQTVSSYIGHSGKVQSTCIYCQAGGHDRTSTAGVCKTGDGEGSKHGMGSSRQSRRSVNAWDWVSEDLDSGTPSTPTSLVNFETETVCGKSARTSPERCLVTDLLSDPTITLYNPTQVTPIIRNNTNGHRVSHPSRITQDIPVNPQIHSSYVGLKRLPDVVEDTTLQCYPITETTL